MWKLFSKSNTKKFFVNGCIKSYNIFPVFRNISFRYHHHDINDCTNTDIKRDEISEYLRAIIGSRGNNGIQKKIYILEKKFDLLIANVRDINETLQNITLIEDYPTHDDVKK